MARANRSGTASRILRGRLRIMTPATWLAILFTAGMYVAGVFAAELRAIRAVNLTFETMAMLRGISYLLPNFENFNVTAPVSHGRGVPAMLMVHATLYAVIYCAIVLAGAAMVFSRRNLK